MRIIYETLQLKLRRTRLILPTETILMIEVPLTNPLIGTMSENLTRTFTFWLTCHISLATASFSVILRSLLLYTINVILPFTVSLLPSWLFGLGYFLNQGFYINCTQPCFSGITEMFQGDLKHATAQKEPLRLFNDVHVWLIQGPLLCLGL